MRNEFDEGTRKSLLETSDLIKEFTDLGLNIWVSKINPTGNITKDLPALSLFRQILEMADGMIELIKTGCINNCKPLLRSSIDCFFQLDFLLKEDIERRSMHFLYHYNKSKLGQLERVLFPERENSFNNKLSADKALNMIALDNNQTHLAWQDHKTLTEILESDLNKITAIEYGPKKRGSWFHFFINSSKIEDLANKTGNSALYEILFRSLSSFIHGEDILHSNIIFINDDTIGLKSLRDITETDSISNSMCTILQSALFLFIGKKCNNDKVLLLELLPIVEKFKLKWKTEV